MLNKNKKFYISIILIVIVFICFSSNSIVVSAVTEQRSESWIYTIVDNAVKITGYTGTETVLNIPSEIDGYQVYSIAGLAENNNITEINVPEGVEGIEDNAFCNCENLKTVNCPSTLLYIGIGAFENCVELSDVKLTSENLYVCDYAFYNTSAIVIEVKKIPDYNYRSFPSGTIFSYNIFTTLLLRFVVSLSISPSFVKMLRPLVLLILCFILAIIVYAIYRISIKIKRLTGKDKNYNYEKYYDSLSRISEKSIEDNNYYVYKEPEDEFLKFRKFLSVAFKCLLTVVIFIMFSTLLFVISDLLDSVFNSIVILSVSVALILILLLSAILIFIIYKIWAYIWNKKIDSKNFRKKSSIRIRLCNKGDRSCE